MICLLALLTAGKGSRTGMYTEIFVSWILQLFAFWFFNFNFFLEKVFLPTTFTHTHTHDPRPLPTTHDPRHLATLQFRGCTFHQRSAETNLTLICPSPKLFVCDLPDSGRHVTRPNQGLSTGGRENLGTRLMANLSIFIPNRIGRCRRYTAPT